MSRSKAWCVFCKIINRQEPATIYYEDDEILCFRDIDPASRFHMLTITKVHIDDFTSLNSNHCDLLQRILRISQDVIVKNGFRLEEVVLGYHRPPFISVKHLHLHSIAPKSEMTVRGWVKYKEGSYWFVSTDRVINELKPQCSF